MGHKALRGRENWETESGKKALNAEQNLIKAFEKHFENTDYEIIDHPTQLKNLYSQVQLSPDEIEQIYNPDIDISKKEWGVSPDFAIKNKKSGKILFGEIKRQDDWVEGKDPSAGRGNAHERLCKLFTPGLLKTYKVISHIDEPFFLPFWVVFQGDITRDPKRVREITYWFDVYKGNYFFWRPNMTDIDLIEFFEKWIKKHLN